MKLRVHDFCQFRALYILPDVKSVCCQALDLYWHEDCLKCGCCDARLGEVGHSLYTKGNLLLCKRDYLRWAEITLCVNRLLRCFVGQIVRVDGLLLCV